MGVWLERSRKIRWKTRNGEMVDVHAWVLQVTPGWSSGKNISGGLGGNAQGT